jgi:hypothetical protein
MAFDFLGTFSETQLSELETYIKSKLTPDIVQSVANNLISQTSRLKKTKNNLEQALKRLQGTTTLTTKRYVKIEISPNKFENKLIENKLFDETLLKDKSSAPLVLNDQIKSMLTTKLKKPFIAEIKLQRENLEHKIKKISDRIEQLEELRVHKLMAQIETDTLLHDLRAIASLEQTQKTSSDLSNKGY